MRTVHADTGRNRGPSDRGSERRGSERRGSSDRRPKEDEDQMTRATWEIDRTAATGTATVAMTVTAADRMAVDSIITTKAMTV